MPCDTAWFIWCTTLRIPSGKFPVSSFPSCTCSGRSDWCGNTSRHWCTRPRGTSVFHKRITRTIQLLVKKKGRQGKKVIGPFVLKKTITFHITEEWVTAILPLIFVFSRPRGGMLPWPHHTCCSSAPLEFRLSKIPFEA